MSILEELKKDLQEDSRKIFLECPSDIKRYYYGIITHSEAGKYNLNQYFGHWVHAYASLLIYSMDILSCIRRLTQDPDISLDFLKKLFTSISKSGNIYLTATYGGLKDLKKYIDKISEALKEIKTKEEFLELLEAFSVYVSRIYWWFHWYFPWGIGPVVCRRLTPEDIKEIVKLSKEAGILGLES